MELDLMQIKLQARVAIMLQDHRPEEVLYEIRRQTAAKSHDEIRILKHVDRVVE